MKFIILSITLVLCSISVNVCATEGNGVLRICQKEVTETNRLEEKDYKATKYGLCSGSKLIVEPRFRKLQYAKDLNLFYGFKQNDYLGESTHDGTLEDFEKYGYTSSVIFNGDGRKKVEIPGVIDYLNKNIGIIAIYKKPLFMGYELSELIRDPGKKKIAYGLIWLDFALEQMGYFLQTSLLLDKAPYVSREKNIRKSTKYGVINEDGEILVEPKFNYIYEPYFSPYSAVRVDDNYGLIDKIGNYILEPKYDYVGIESIPDDINAPKAIVGKKQIFTKEKTCGFFTCDLKMQFIDTKTMQVSFSWNGSRYKHLLVRTIYREFKHPTGDNLVGIMAGGWLAGTVILWPLFFVYYFISKKQKIGSAIIKGLGWSSVASALLVILTVIIMFFAIIFFFSIQLVSSVDD